MLTQNQKQLIEKLESEFAKLNKPLEKATNRLINKADIDNRINESNIIIAELEAIENASNEAIKEMIEKDMERLNQDLNEMGLGVYKKGEFRINIDIINNFNKNFSGINISYRREQCYSSLPHGNAYKHYAKFSCISIYLNPHREDTFKDIDTLCADNRFVREIELLYNQTKKQ